MVNISLTQQRWAAMMKAAVLREAGNSSRLGSITILWIPAGTD
jgi:hypothetical protein